MEADSPKGFDLRRDSRFAVHCGVTDQTGESGEVIVTGRAKYIEDPGLRALAVRLSPYPAADRYILFELDVESVVTTEYPGGKALRKRWQMNEEGN